MDTIRLRIQGDIGGGRIERAFCRLAHEAARGGEPNWEACSQTIAGCCALANFKSRCLFLDLLSSDWEIVERSVAIEAGLAARRGRLLELEVAHQVELITADELAAERGWLEISGSS